MEGTRGITGSWKKPQSNIKITNLYKIDDTIKESDITTAKTNWEILRTQGRCISSSSSKCNKKSEDKSENESLLSVNSKGDQKKLSAQSTNRNVSKSYRKPFKFFTRLPPILVPLFADITNYSGSDSAKRSSSNCSIDPTIDSLSSDESINESDEEKYLNTSRGNLLKNINTNNLKQEQCTIVDTNKHANQTDIPNDLEPSDNSKKNYPSDNNSTKSVLENREISTKNRACSANDKSHNSSFIKSTNPKTNSNNICSQTQNKLTISTNTVETNVKKIEKSINKNNYQSTTLANKNNSSKMINRFVKTKVKPQVNDSISAVFNREREQGADYLIEICGRYLNVFGQNSLRFIDKPWNPIKANDVTCIKFSYINFNSMANIFYRIKARFPNAEHFVFTETNISVLSQLNALAEIQGLVSLHINDNGNPITQKKWNNYALFRLNHWGLKNINGHEVTEADKQAAEMEYSGLLWLVLLSLPDEPLKPLLTRMHLDGSATASHMGASQWLWAADHSLRSVVAKEALQSHHTIDSPSAFAQVDAVEQERSRNLLSTLLNNTSDAVEKLQKLENCWMGLLLQIIKNTLIDYLQLDTYVKQIMVELCFNTPTE